MLYPNYLGICIAASNTGKTVHWLNELAAAPPCPSRERVYIYSFAQDSQFEGVKLPHCPVKICSYEQFKPEDIPPNTFVVLDELNDALMKDPSLLKPILNMYTTRAHHNAISVVSICQTILGTPAFAIL